MCKSSLLLLLLRLATIKLCAPFSQFSPPSSPALLSNTAETQLRPYTARTQQTAQFQPSATRKSDASSGTGGDGANQN